MLLLVVATGSLVQSDLTAGDSVPSTSRELEENANVSSSTRRTLCVAIRDHSAWSVSLNWDELCEAAYYGTADWDGAYFSETGSLTRLSLPDYSLGQGIPGELSELVGLRLIDIHSNSLTSMNIPGYPSLNYIDISFNSIRGGAPDLSGLRYLTYIDMAHNFVTDVPQGWRNLYLKYLDLSYNSFSGKAPYYFSGTSLTSLKIAHNALNEVHSLWASLEELAHLDLSYNSITNVPSGWSRWTSLTHLDLSHNSLTAMPPDWSSLRLRSLNISQNGLADLPSQWSMVLLSSLDVSSNYILALPHQLSTFSSLELLDISHNQIHDLPPSLSSLKSLLWVNNGLVGIIPQIVANFTSLTYLNVAQNRLNSLDTGEWSQQSEHLEVLVAAHNRIASLAEGVLELSSLTKLDVSFNDLVSVPSTGWNRVVNLKHVSFAHNNLSILPPSLELLTLLTSIDVSNNMVTSVPREWSELQNLQHLDMSCNCLTGQVPAEWSMLSQLQHLNFSSNEISDIHSVDWGYMSSLKRLDLAHNLCAMLPLQLPSLNSLNIAYNNFTEVPEPWSQVHTLTYLNMSGNPWSTGTCLPSLQVLEVDLAQLEQQGHGFGAFLDCLSQLTRLHLPPGTRVFDLSPLRKLPSLQEIHGPVDRSLTRIQGLRVPEDCYAEGSRLTTKVKALNLQGNRIQLIEGYICLFDQAVLVNLSNNALEEFGGIWDMPMLDTLLIHDCQLHTYPLYQLAHLPLITRLDVESNPLMEVHGVQNSTGCITADGERLTTSLAAVDLSGFQIRTIEGFICYLDHVGVMNLSFNALERLGGKWDLPALQTLDVSHNALQTQEFPKIPYVKHLNASSNSIASLEVDDVSIFHQLPLLESLYLGDNPVFDITSESFEANSLHLLDLRNSNVSHVAPKAWETLNAVSTIIINNAPIENITPCLSGGSSMCTGTFQSARTLFCMKLLNGEYCPNSKGSFLCEPGHACFEGVRIECEEGTYAPGGSAQCSVCPPGRYTEASGVSQCLVCEPGFACQQGRRSICPSGTAAGLGSSSCSACVDGTYSAQNGSTSCIPCEAGYACSGGGRDPCEPGMFSGTGAEACEPCNPGSYSFNASATCLTCEEGFACPANEGDTKQRYPCPAGRFAGRGASSCTSCSPGSWSPTRSKICSTCPPGTIYNYSLTHAGGGNATIGEANCISCPSGTFYLPANDTHAPVCATCPPGHYCQGYTSLPTPCPLGRYSESLGSIACLPCPQHTMGVRDITRRDNLSTSCVSCPIGTYTVAPGQGVCNFCPARTIGVQSAIQTNDSEATPSPWHGRCIPCSRQGLLALDDSCLPGGLRPLNEDITALSSMIPELEILQNKAYPHIAPDTSQQLTVVASVVGSSNEEAPSFTLLGLPVEAFVYVSGGAACILAITVIIMCRKRVGAKLKRIDIFNLDHPIQPAEVITSKPTLLGGGFTVAAGIVIVTLLVNAAHSFLSPGNQQQSMKVVPVAELPSQGTQSFQINFHVYGDDPVLDHSVDTSSSNYSAVSVEGCPLVKRVTSSFETQPLRCEMLEESFPRMACTCSVLPETQVDEIFTFAYLSTVTFTLHPRVTVVAGRLVTQSATGNFSTIDMAAPLRSPEGAVGGIIVSLRALPDLVDNQIEQKETTGYTLFSQGAQYSGIPTATLRGGETTEVEFTVQLADLGRSTLVEVRTTFIQAISSVFGLIVGSIGAVRLGFRYTRRFHRRVRRRKVGSSICKATR